MQYPKKKNGIKANVLCIERTLLKGNNPIKMLMQTAPNIINLVLFKILLGINCSINLQYIKLSKYHNICQGVNIVLIDIEST